MITLKVSWWELVATGYLDPNGYKRVRVRPLARENLDANMNRQERNLIQIQLLILQMERQLVIITAMTERLRRRGGLQ